MAYRKIEVLGKTYEYVIGRDFVKIKGVGLYERTVDFTVPGYNPDEEGHMTDQDSAVHRLKCTTTGRYVQEGELITPADIKSIILRNPT
jgi:hypothetical protein